MKKTGKTTTTTSKKKTSSRSLHSGTKSHSHSEIATGLRELFVAGLKDIYWAEKALTKAIPKMVKNASTEELQDALTDHLDVTEEQIIRLEQVFELLEIKPQAKKCEAMAGLIQEAEDIMNETKNGVVRDAGIISAGQKVEHYEIATYGTLCAFAKTLGEFESADLLEVTLNEEKDADATLSEIAESSINFEAAEMAMVEAIEEEEEEEAEEEEEEEEEEEAE